MHYKKLLMILLYTLLIGCGEEIPYNQENSEPSMEIMQVELQNTFEVKVSLNTGYSINSAIYVILSSNDANGVEQVLTVRKLEDSMQIRVPIPEAKNEGLFIYAFSDEDQNGEYTIGDYFSMRKFLTPPFDQYEKIELDVRFKSMAFQAVGL